ncbi:MAG: 23S rRNA (adenine(1618)-N(6))-methyltransferase RlmF [Saprospiraceae bacterium]|nr:23S rRNA (adenine(1618)-N(6))-methyltransferase RlmF [Saprospiraceae bacterium]
MPAKNASKEDTKKEHPVEKTRLHRRNRHRERYDFTLLSHKCPELIPFVSFNKYGDESIDFSNPEAVRMLNKALLMQYYDIKEWDLASGYLCPPIPGRADYIHYAADLLSQKNFGKVPKGSNITCLDIGVGASCIYPIIGIREYGWTFIGSDIDQVSIAAAKKIVASNPVLQNKIEIRIQANPEDIFKNIIKENECVDLTICNPPFHASPEEALLGNLRKVKNLKLGKEEKSTLNFGGQQHELWCKGGEHEFVQNMIVESKMYRDNCFWFTTLISKQSNLKRAYQAQEKAGIQESRTIPMGQGNKTSRILAWTFLNPKQQTEWVKKRWK